MTISELKQYIYQQNKISFVLEQLGCTKIKYHPIKQYFTCCNADNGDNPNAVIVYQNERLNVTNYTRDLKKYDAFPTDVWVKKIMAQKYNVTSKNEKVIREKGREIFGPYAGYAQQFLFHYYRTTEAL